MECYHSVVVVGGTVVNFIVYSLMDIVNAEVRCALTDERVLCFLCTTLLCLFACLCIAQVCLSTEFDSGLDK